MPTVRRALKFGLGGVVLGTGATLWAPREALPTPALKYRVVCEGLGRMARCGVVGAGILYDYKTSGLTDDSPQEDWDVVHVRSAEKLVRLAEENGALYVKCGQGFAQMNHLLPRAYCRVMAKLEDSVSFRPLSEVLAVVERELGKPVSELFSAFDEQPLAAASLAQVHRATVRETAEEVALKVQYIDVQDRFDGDMLTIRTCLSVCGFFFPGFDFGMLMARSDETLRAELDFVAEARNSERCARELAAEFGGRVTTPKVLWPLTSSRVMATQFVHGVKMTDAAGMRRMGLSVAEASSLLIEAMAYTMFHTGFVHADPHAGNVFVRPMPGNSKRPQIVLLDHGLYTELDSRSVDWFANTWTAAVRHDDEGMRASCRAVGVNADLFPILGALVLQFPYESFSPWKLRATASDLERMRHEAGREMAKYTELLEALPIEYGLVLRNVNAVRSVMKELGNPVRRTAIMLRYSVRRSDADASWMALQWTLLRLRFNEWYTDLLLGFARWMDPVAVSAAEDMFTLG